MAQRPDTPIPRPPLEAAPSMNAGLRRRQPDSDLTLLSEPPDLHTQLESIFHAVFNAEADARLDDRIDLSLGIRQPKARL
jgi:hypothetical protein